MVVSSWWYCVMTLQMEKNGEKALLYSIHQEDARLKGYVNYNKEREGRGGGGCWWIWTWPTPSTPHLRPKRSDTQDKGWGGTSLPHTPTSHPLQYPRLKVRLSCSRKGWWSYVYCLIRLSGLRRGMLLVTHTSISWPLRYPRHTVLLL